MGDFKLEEVSDWMNLPITREFRRRLLLRFDHQMAILGSTSGTSVDRLKGVAEVLEYVLKPIELFED